MSEQGTTVTGDFDPASWDMVGSMVLSEQLVSGDVLSDLADADPRICVLTADLGGPTRVVGFRDRHPERYFNFGIAERGMVSAAAGMAATGLRPYVSGYASFLAILALEQIRTDICYPDMPVRLLGTHSGIAMGFYGTSHHATEDIGLLRALPNLSVVAPVDAASLATTLRATVDHPHPLYVRLSRGRDAPVYTGGREAALSSWRIGGSARLREGIGAARGDRGAATDTERQRGHPAATLLATGTTVASALAAADQLADDGVDAAVVDMYSLRPIDVDAVRAATADDGLVVTVEEHGPVGGLGSAVADAMVSHRLGNRLRKVALPDEYSILGPPSHLYRHYGIDAEGIRAAVLDELGAAP